MLSMITNIKIFISPSTDVFFNQAVEIDLFFKVEEGEYILYLWQNDGVVVIGRNQRAKAEVDLKALHSDGKTLARRLSGGGAVYHDKGNLNFTFIAKSTDFDKDRNRKVILSALKSLGFDATLTGRNDIEVDGHKISGNAYYKSGDKEFHHGTLLIDSKAEEIAKYLTPSAEKFDGKGVRSVVSRVKSLCDFKPVTIDEVISAIAEQFQEEFKTDCEAGVVTATEERVAFFSDKGWRYGDDRVFDRVVKTTYDGSKVTLHLDFEGKVVTDCLVESDSLDCDIENKISKEILGKNLDVDSGEIIDRIKEEIYGV